MSLSLLTQPSCGGLPAVRVVVAHRDPLVRAALRRLLENEHGIEVAGEAVNSREAIALACAVRPDVVLMDAPLRDLDGLRATRRIVAQLRVPEAGVLIVSDRDSAQDLFGALRAGAGGFLTLDAEPTELVRAVRSVARSG